jgi:hypothetical protein
MKEKLRATEQTADRRSVRSIKRRTFYAETMSVRLPLWLSVSCYRRLNSLPGFHEIRHMNSLKKVLECEFSEKRRTDSRTSRKAEINFYPQLPHFLSDLDVPGQSPRDDTQHLRVSLRSAIAEAIHYSLAPIKSFPYFLQFSSDLNKIRRKTSPSNATDQSRAS